MQSSERTTFTDPLTGRPVTQSTSFPAKDQHLYFTSDRGASINVYEAGCAEDPS